MIQREHRAGAEDRRATVLEAAMYLIAERSLDGVSMRDIAERAGMSAGHILYYFGSKDALLLEVLRWSEEELAERRRAALAGAHSKERAAARYLELYLPHDAHDPRWHLWIQMHARPPSDEHARMILLGLIQGWIDDLSAIIGDAELAERICSLMDGLALDTLLGLPGRTRARALRITTEALRLEERRAR